MKKLTIEQEFDYPLEVLLRAREERYKHLDKFPELKNVTIVSEERNGDIMTTIRHISIADSMPAVIATLLPSGADTLVENSEFNVNNHLHTFRVIPGGNLENIFVVNGVSRYYEIDAEKSARNYEIEVTSKAFLVSMVVENAIAELYHNNLEKDRKSILNFIKILQEEESGDGS